MHLVPRLINAVPVETTRGYRTISLVQGEPTAASADTAVLSSHAGDGLPGGATVEAWRNAFDVPVETLDSLLVIPGTRGQAGSFEVVDENIGPVKHLLVVRLPGRRFIDHGWLDAETVFTKGLWTLFGSLAALELRGDKNRIGRVSLPLLGGNRDYPLEPSVGALLSLAMRWLATSSTGEGVQLVAWEENTAQAWSEAINDALGRRSVRGDRENLVLDTLRHRLLVDLDQPSGLSEATSSACASLRDTLAATGRSLSIQQTAVFARVFAEALVQQLAGELECPWKGKFMADIEAVINTKQVAPWIGSHLHTLRILGNEAVHTSRSHHLPSALGEDDLTALLSALVGLMGFWGEWRQSHPA